MRAISSSSFVGITHTSTGPRLMRRSSVRRARFNSSSSSHRGNRGARRCARDQRRVLADAGGEGDASTPPRRRIGADVFAAR